MTFDSRIRGYSSDFLSHYVSTRFYNMSGMSKIDTAMLQEFLMEINTPSSTLSRFVCFIPVFFSIIFSMVVFITASDDKGKNQKNLCCLLPYVSFRLFINAFQIMNKRHFFKNTDHISLSEKFYYQRN